MGTATVTITAGTLVTTAAVAAVLARPAESVTIQPETTIDTPTGDESGNETTAGSSTALQPPESVPAATSTPVDSAPAAADTPAPAAKPAAPTTTAKLAAPPVVTTTTAKPPPPAPTTTTRTPPPPPTTTGGS